MIDIKDKHTVGTITVLPLTVKLPEAGFAGILIRLMGDTETNFRNCSFPDAT